MELNVKTLLNLIFDAKIQGKGRQGRGRIYSQLIAILTNDDQSVASETFGGNIDRFLLRLLRDETEYPFQLFNTESFSHCVGNYSEAKKYLLKMKDFCSSVLDSSKLDMLVYSLLEIINADRRVSRLIYGNADIEKEALMGSLIHPKQICLEALLLYALYHVHRYPSNDPATILTAQLPKRLPFRCVRFDDISSLRADVTVNLREFIIENSESLTAPLERELIMKHNDGIIHKLPDENLFLYGNGGVGKSALLSRAAGDKVCFFLKYNQIRYDLITEILLRYRYLEEYATEHEWCVIEGERQTLQDHIELERLFKAPPLSSQPEFLLIIDDINDVRPEDDERIFAEIQAILNDWKNVRIMFSGRRVPDHKAFSKLSKIEVLGIADEELSDYVGIDDNAKELIRRPLLLSTFTDESGNYQKAGQLLDHYYQDYEVSRFGNDTAVVFMIKLVIPFIARKMAELRTDSLKLSQVSEIIGKSLDLLLNNSRIYLNYVAPKGMNKNTLPQGRDEQITLILDTGIMLRNGNGELSFEGKIHRDYFAARCIINAIEILDVSFSSDEIQDKSDAFSALALGDIWFEDEAVYRLIGEIAGDHRNTPESPEYHKTQLDVLLKMCHEFSCFRVSENIIKAMAAARDNLICDVDFSSIPLPLIVPSYIKFSDKNGELPCDFNGCKVMYLGLLEPLRFCAVSESGNLILAAFENAFFVLWNDHNSRIIWEKDLHIYTDVSGEFDFAEFTENDAFILISDFKYVLKINANTGEFIGRFTHDECPSYGYDEYLNSSRCPCGIDTKKLHLDIIKQLSHFENCDFRNSGFMFEEYRHLLAEMKASLNDNV